MGWAAIAGVLTGIFRCTDGAARIAIGALLGLVVLVSLETMRPRTLSGACAIEITTTDDRARWELRVEATTPSASADFRICQPYLHSFQAWTRFASNQQDELRISTNDAYVTITNQRNEIAVFSVGHGGAEFCVRIPWEAFAKSLRGAIGRAADRGLQFID